MISIPVGAGFFGSKFMPECLALQNEPVVDLDRDRFAIAAN